MVVQTPSPCLPGCYPRCPKHRPIYDEDLKKCVTGDQCGCYIEGTHYPPGKLIPTKEICKTWYLYPHDSGTNTHAHVCTHADIATHGQVHTCMSKPHRACVRTHTHMLGHMPPCACAHKHRYIHAHMSACTTHVHMVDTCMKVPCPLSTGRALFKLALGLCCHFGLGFHGGCL